MGTGSSRDGGTRTRRSRLKNRKTRIRKIANFSGVTRAKPKRRSVARC